MRIVWLALLAACLAVNVSAATIGFTSSNLGGGIFQYTYSISNLPACPPCLGETVDITFDPTVYASLVDGQANPATDWSLMLFQPDVPPGAFGDYFATALVSNPSLAGPFTVNVTLHPGAQLGPQAFTIYDANFNPIGFGTTSSSTVPEPAGFPLTVTGTLIGAVCWYSRRRLARRA
jgi:hypothetical protein